MRTRFPDFLMLIGGLVGLCIAMVACQQVGRIAYRYNPDGKLLSLDVVQPPLADSPASVIPTTQPGNLGASTGATSPAAQSIQGATAVATAQVHGRMIAGIVLLVLGVGALVARAWFPLIPVAASMAAMGAGVLVLMVPTLDQWAVVGIVAVAALVVLIGFLHNSTTAKAAATATTPGATP
jgi:hypothetical protein